VVHDVFEDVCVVEQTFLFEEVVVGGRRLVLSDVRSFGRVSG